MHCSKLLTRCPHTPPPPHPPPPRPPPRPLHGVRRHGGLLPIPSPWHCLGCTPTGPVPIAGDGLHRIPRPIQSRYRTLVGADGRSGGAEGRSGGAEGRYRTLVGADHASVQVDCGPALGINGPRGEDQRIVWWASDTVGKLDRPNAAEPSPLALGPPAPPSAWGHRAPPGAAGLGRGDS